MPGSRRSLIIRTTKVTKKMQHTAKKVGAVLHAQQTEQHGHHAGHCADQHAGNWRTAETLDHEAKLQLSQQPDHQTGNQHAHDQSKQQEWQ